MPLQCLAHELDCKSFSISTEQAHPQIMCLWIAFDLVMQRTKSKVLISWTSERTRDRLETNKRIKRLSRSRRRLYDRGQQESRKMRRVNSRTSEPAMSCRETTSRYSSHNRGLNRYTRGTRDSRLVNCKPYKGLNPQCKMRTVSFLVRFSVALHHCRTILNEFLLT